MNVNQMISPVWKTEDVAVDYPAAVSFMEETAVAIRNDGAKDMVWLLEHPSLYTAGTSAKEEDLLSASLPVYQTGRGGQYTYHGPGQRVAYVMMDLKKRGSDLRAYVRDLETWVIRTLAEFGVHGERREGRVGIWVVTKKGEAKIAAIGVRVKRWVAYHGIAINLAPDLSHYKGIVPCGISQHGVTSLQDLDIDIDMAALDSALKRCFTDVFTDAA